MTQLTDPHRFGITAIVLAAGLSRRMGVNNKLLTEYRGQPLISHVTDMLLASAVTEIIVVTGYQEDLIQEAVTGDQLKFVHNHQFEEGLSSSLRCGIASVSSDAHGAMICLGDMPLVTTKIIDELIHTFEKQSCNKICVPTKKGKWGNPVLWPRHFFSSILQSCGDAGARWLMLRNPESIHEIDTNSEGIFTDIDTPERLKNIPIR